MLNRVGSYLIIISFIIVVAHYLMRFIEEWLHLNISTELKVAVLLFLAGLLLFLAQYLFDLVTKKDKYEGVDK